MSKLDLRVVLAAVDRITAPLKKMRESGTATSTALKATQDTVKRLDKQLGQISGYRSTGRQLGITGQQLAKAQQEVKRLALEMKFSETPSKALTREFEQARAATVRLITQQKALTQRYQEQRQALNSAGINTKQLSSHQRQLTQQLSQANSALTQQKQRLSEVAAQQKKLNQVRQTYDNTMSMRNNLAGNGAAMVATGAAAAAVGAKPVIEFAKAETAATDLKVSMMGVGGQVRSEFKAINELATKLGNRLPGTTADFQNMMTTLVQQGMSAKAILGGLGEATAFLGVQMKLPFNAAAEFAAKLQDATGTAEKDMMGLMDVIQRSYYLGVGQDNMLMAFSKLSSALPVLRKSGLEAAQVLSPLIVMADQAGMAGEASGNAYRKAFQASMDAKKVNKANDILKERGVQLNFTDGKGEFAGLDNMFGELAKLKALNTETRLQVLKEVYGDDAETLQVMNLMITKGIDGYRETQAKMKAQADLQTRVNEQLGTLTNLWDSASGTFTNALVIFGEAVAPELKAMTTWLAEVSEGLGTWAKENPKLAAGIMKTIGLVAAVTITLGTLALGVSAVLGPFALLRKTLAVLGITWLPALGTAFKAVMGVVLGFGKALLLSPITWIIAGIAALAVGIYMVIKHWSTVKAWLGNFWSGVKNLTNLSVADVLGGMKNLWSSAGQYWDAGVNQLKTIFNGLPEPVKQVLSGIWDVMKTVFGWTPLGLIVSNFDTIVSFFQSLPARFRSLGEMTIDGLLSGITGKLGELKATLINAADSTSTWFKEKLGIASPSKVFISHGQDTINGLTKGLEQTKPSALSSVQQLAAQMAKVPMAIAAITLPATQLAFQPLPQQQQATVQQLVPAALAKPQDQVQRIKQQLQPLKAIHPQQAKVAVQELPPKRSSPQQQTAGPTNFASGSALSPAKASAGTKQITIDASLNAPITIHAAPGMDAKELTRLVAQELDRRERLQQARLRASLKDTE